MYFLISPLSQCEQLCLLIRPALLPLSSARFTSPSSPSPIVSPSSHRPSPRLRHYRLLHPRPSSLSSYYRRHRHATSKPLTSEPLSSVLSLYTSYRLSSPTCCLSNQALWSLFQRGRLSSFPFSLLLLETSPLRTHTDSPPYSSESATSSARVAHQFGWQLQNRAKTWNIFAIIFAYRARA